MDRILAVLRKLWHIPGRAWAGMMAANLQALRIWLQAAGQFAMTIFAAGVVLIIWLGPWTDAVELKRIDGVVWIALGCLIIVAIYAVAMTLTNLNLHAGRDGLNIGIGQDDDASAPQAVRTTTTTEVIPGGAAPSPASAAPAKPLGPGELPLDQRYHP